MRWVERGIGVATSVPLQRGPLTLDLNPPGAEPRKTAANVGNKKVSVTVKFSDGYTITVSFPKVVISHPRGDGPGGYDVSYSAGGGQVWDKSLKAFLESKWFQELENADGERVGERSLREENCEVTFSDTGKTYWVPKGKQLWKERA